MSAKKKRVPLDLVQVRHELTLLRNKHAHDQLVCRLVNEILVQTAYLSKPLDDAHQERLLAEISNVSKAVERATRRKTGH